MTLASQQPEPTTAIVCPIERERQRVVHLVLGRPRPKPSRNRARKGKVAPIVRLAPGIEEQVQLREAYSHKSQGTPQTHAHAAAAARRVGSLPRLVESGAIDAHQLAAAQQIAEAFEATVADVSVRIANYEVRGTGGGPLAASAEPIAAVIRDRAYSAWRAAVSAQVALPDVPRFTTNYGLRANTMQIGMARSGLLNATLAMIGKGETAPVEASTAGVPTVFGDGTVDRFAQASGAIRDAGAVVGGIASAQFTYSNALEKVETIQPDGEIEDVDPGMPAFTGSLVLKNLGSAIEASGRDGTPRPIEFGWTRGTHSLRFAAPRVFFPRVKVPIEGPQGMQQSVDFLASSVGGVTLTATLVNDVTSYA